MLETIAIQNEHLFFCKLVRIRHSSIIHDSYTNANESGQSLQNASRKSKIEEIIPYDNSIRHILVCNGSRTAKTNETAKVGHTMFYLCFIRLERVDRVFYYTVHTFICIQNSLAQIHGIQLQSRFIIVRRKVFFRLIQFLKTKRFQHIFNSLT